MDDLLAAAGRRHGDMVERLRVLVTHETPAGSVPHLAAAADLLSRWGSDALGREPERVADEGPPHLLWAAEDQRVLLLAHFDTVWPAGTVRAWPFTVDGDEASGPGVCDMKGGIVQLLTALELLGATAHVGLLLTADEETGSVTSRKLIEREARRSGAVLVCEPSTPDGDLKVARKGGSVYRLSVLGRAAHAGVEPHKGVNATVEAAHQILALQDIPATGTSVTPTLMTAGTTTNTVPERATLTVDVRAWTADELHRVDRAIRALTPHHPEAALSVDGGVNRYPMTADVAGSLLDLAVATAVELGIEPPGGAHVAGASDANFTAGLGVPTLDGLGAVGDGSHARTEHIDLRRMPERTALLAGLIARLTRKSTMD